MFVEPRPQFKELGFNVHNYLIKLPQSHLHTKTEIQGFNFVCWGGQKEMSGAGRHVWSL